MAIQILRVILGLFLLAMGLNKFLGFLPGMILAPPAAEFMGALAETGYMLRMVGVVEIVSGAMLLSRATAPFATILLAPLSVNVVLFHLFLDPSTIFFAAFVFVSNVILGAYYFDRYRPIFVRSAVGESMLIGTPRPEKERKRFSA